MDSLDRKILKRIQVDAVLPVGTIADQIGISKSACWRRIQKLESDGVIRARVALLDEEQVDLPLTVYISVRTNQHNEEWMKTFREVTSTIPAVLEAYRMSGDLDYLIKAVVKDMKDYDELYKKLIAADLFDVSASFVMETMKRTTQLPLD